MPKYIIASALISFIILLLAIASIPKIHRITRVRMDVLLMVIFLLFPFLFVILLMMALTVAN